MANNLLEGDISSLFSTGLSGHHHHRHRRRQLLQTSSPLEELDVSGNVNITGSLDWSLVPSLRRFCVTGSSATGDLRYVASFSTPLIQAVTASVVDPSCLTFDRLYLSPEQQSFSVQELNDFCDGLGYDTGYDAGSTTTVAATAAMTQLMADFLAWLKGSAASVRVTDIESGDPIRRLASGQLLGIVDSGCLAFEDLAPPGRKLKPDEFRGVCGALVAAPGRRQRLERPLYSWLDGSQKCVIGIDPERLMLVVFLLASAGGILLTGLVAVVFIHRADLAALRTAIAAMATAAATAAETTTGGAVSKSAPAAVSESTRRNVRVVAASRRADATPSSQPPAAAGGSSSAPPHSAVVAQASEEAEPGSAVAKAAADLTATAVATATVGAPVAAGRPLNYSPALTASPPTTRQRAVSTWLL